MKKLLKRRKYLRIILNSHAPSEDGQHFSQKLSGKANNNISILGLYSTNGKANSQASYKAKTKTSNKKYYKARQVRQQV